MIMGGDLIAKGKNPANTLIYNIEYLMTYCVPARLWHVIADGLIRRWRHLHVPL